MVQQAGWAVRECERNMRLTKFKRIFETINVGSLVLKNRILMPAMHLNMADEGAMTNGLIDFYEERAKADPGPGLMILGGCYTERRGMGTPSMVAIDDDRCLPGLKRFTDRIHKHGQPVAAQLYHSGRYAFSFLSGEQPVSASAVPSNFNPEVPHELTQEEIIEVELNFGKAAHRAQQAGFDAVELIVCGGYIVNQFLSPLVNKRTDRYNGDIDARMTFMREVIAAIREAVGPDYPFTCRLSGSDFVEGSHTLDDTKIVAAEMERCGVDMISVTGGWHETRVPQITMNVPRGAFVYLAEGIRESVEKIPVACCNRINTPDLAEQILADDRADIVGMARAFLADPKFLRKAYEGRTEDIRTCVACNQGCLDHVFMLQPISCTVNPRVNRERETELESAAEKKKVLVAGGGPAGMEAAWVAANRGHAVTLCEEAAEVGGQGLLAAVPPGREEWGEMVRYLARQVDRNGVKVMLGTKVTPELVNELEPDVLVLATGARQLIPGIEGIDGQNVVNAWDVLTGISETGDTVVVVGGGAVGIETATYLAEDGRNVTVVEMLDRCGADIGPSSRWVILKDAASAGVKMIKSCLVSRIIDEGVVTESAGEERVLAADTVVIAVGSRPEDELFKGLSDAGALEGMEFHKAGDCAKPRKVYDAIHEGFDIGRQI
jgi:2,4-dienoyl-CoA reductase (NADPH2)